LNSPAAEAGCTTILSEDLAGATRIAGIAILNPFAARGLAEQAQRLLSQR